MLREGARLLAAFRKRFPQAKLARSEHEVLEDASIQLVLSAAIPNERAPLGIRVMQHGKDYMADKPGITTLAQLAEVRRVQAADQAHLLDHVQRAVREPRHGQGRRAGQGRRDRPVVQTIGLGPHRIDADHRARRGSSTRRASAASSATSRSHQADQFLFFTGSTRAEVVAAQVGNVHHPQYPDFEDFGDVMLRGDGGTGYIRVDWFTPDGLVHLGRRRA